jgi:hypothetical protein
LRTHQGAQGSLDGTDVVVVISIAIIVINVKAYILAGLEYEVKLEGLLKVGIEVVLLSFGASCVRGGVPKIANCFWVKSRL